jgi:hypothetical protein
VSWPSLRAARSRLNRGIDQAAVEAIPSGDGTLQLTVGGWPIYRFAGDTRAGQAGGQGSGGTWFAIGPDGHKAGSGRAGADGDNDRNREDDDKNNGGGNGGNTATNITLFDEPGRSGSDVAQGAPIPRLMRTAASTFLAAARPPPSRPAVPTRSGVVPAAQVVACAWTGTSTTSATRTSTTPPGRCASRLAAERRHRRLPCRGCLSWMSLGLNQAWPGRCPAGPGPWVA